MAHLPRNKSKRRRDKHQSVSVNSNYEFYNSTRWRKHSKAYRQLNPLCEIGLEFGEVRGCDVTDHVIPINQGGAKWDERNLCAMSHRYHNVKRNLESRGIYAESRKNADGDLIPYNEQSVYNLFDRHCTG